jgi:hypothetical protein
MPVPGSEVDAGGRVGRLRDLLLSRALTFLLSYEAAPDQMRPLEAISRPNHRQSFELRKDRHIHARPPAASVPARLAYGSADCLGFLHRVLD